MPTVKETLTWAAIAFSPKGKDYYQIVGKRDGQLSDRRFDFNGWGFNIEVLSDLEFNTLCHIVINTSNFHAADLSLATHFTGEVVEEAIEKEGREVTTEWLREEIQEDIRKTCQGIMQKIDETAIAQRS